MLKNGLLVLSLLISVPLHFSLKQQIWYTQKIGKKGSYLEVTKYS